MQPRDFDAIGNAGYGQEFEKLLYVIFLREGLSAADAQDQTQELLIKAFKRQRSGRSLPDTPETLKSWLTARARWRCKDFYRKQNGRGKPKRPRMIPLSNFGERDSVASDPLDLKEFVVKVDETARMTWLELLEIRGGVQLVDTVKHLEWGHTKKETARLLGLTVRKVAEHQRLAQEIVGRALSA